ncbi:MAG: type VI secretion system tip protein TssI/VgrG [bacterium]
MPPFGSGEAQFLCKISDLEFRVAGFTALERISSPFGVNLSLAIEDEVDFSKVIGKEALLTIIGHETDRFFHGLVVQFRQKGSKGRFFLYQAGMAPSLWLLSFKQNCRIFQGKSVQDITKQILQEAGIPADRFDFRLQGTYQPREYCVQYRETDLNFISRLLEEEGIFYFFEHTADKHLLVFGDGTVTYQPIQGQAKVLYHPADTMVPEEEVVQTFFLSRQIQSGKVTLQDYNFEKPSLNLTAQKEAGDFPKLELYDYPGRYLEEGDGKKLAQIRLEEAMAFMDKAEGKSGCPRFTPGFTFTLTDHEREDFNREYLLVKVKHKGSQPQVFEEQAGGEGFSYANDFLAVPSSVTFRPERRTRKPVVEGVQTAVVVGPKGEEIYTDEHGRIKVQFHWDREGKQDEKSSCWIRVSQAWAGTGWGSIYIPRIGQEIIVDFLEGDPDKPIITGRVYNADNTVPYKLPDEKTKSTLKSLSSTGGQGFNEIRFEDKKGEEQIFIHAEKDQDIRVKHDARTWVGNESHLMVKKDFLSLVEGDKHLSVKGDHNEKVDGAISLESGTDIQEKAGNNHALEAGSEIHLKAGQNLIIEAGTNITLKVGGNFVVLNSSGVTVSGTQILLNSGGSAGSGSGCSPEAPKEPMEADTAKPGKAAKPKPGSPSSSPQAQAMREAAKSGTPLCEK